MNIEELTLKQIKELSGIIGTGNQLQAQKPHPFQVGENYFIRTVTHHHTGKLTWVGDTELVLENAAWIADDGKLTDSLKSGNFNEVEMFPKDAKVIIGRGSIIDATVITNIPTSQK